MRLRGGGGLKLEYVFFTISTNTPLIVGDAKEAGKFHIQSTYYARDVKADISLHMRTIKLKLGKSFNDDFMELKLYVKTQMKVFKNLQKIKKRTGMESMEPGNTSFSEAGIYNGLPWVLLCLGRAINFNDDTMASTLYSYMW